MDEPTKTKSCKTCSRFDNYYTKGNAKFERTNFGFCSLQQKTVECTCCDAWKRRSYFSERRKTAAVRSLREILTHLSALRQIFEENAEEEKQIRKIISRGEKKPHETDEQ